MTIAILYLLGRMPEADEKAYEIHLLECRSCLARAEAVEHALRYRGCFQGEMRDMREDGNRKAAMDACWQALGLRKDSQPANDCFEQAKALPVGEVPNTQGPESK